MNNTSEDIKLIVGGDIDIRLRDLPEWNDFPNRGEDRYDVDFSKEFELTDGLYEISVIVHFSGFYTRWYRPMTFEEPEEDEITGYYLEVTPIKGYKEYLGFTWELNDKDKEQVKNYVLSQIKNIVDY